MNIIWKYTLFITFSVLLDQISKGIVQNFFLLGEEKVLISSFLKLVHIQSSATALGFGNDWNIKIFSLLILLWSFRRLIILRKDSYLKGIPYVLIIAGLSGNLMDRILYGHVVSFLKISYWVFNFSDVLIMGALILSVFNLAHSVWSRSVSPLV